MSNVVRLVINDRPQELVVKEYQGQRVVTFRNVDELHGRPDGTARRNFSENKSRFIEGTDYFRLSGEEANRTNFVQLASPNGLTVITESGYLMLVKSFTDDLAWEVQRQLVNGYFRAKEIASQFQIPQTYPEALRLAANLAEENERQKQTIAIMEPKAEFHDAVAVAENCQEIGEVARILGTGRNRMFRWLREQRILIPGTRVPYQSFIDEGYFRVIEQTWESKSGRVNLATKTVVTGKGLLWLQKRYYKGA